MIEFCVGLAIGIFITSAIFSSFILKGEKKENE